MKVKFNSSENFIHVKRYTIGKNFVKLIDDKLSWDLGGFKIYEDDEETIVRDCSDYNYKWNVYTEYSNGVVLTNSETDREPPPKDLNPVEIVDPLSNEELTTCVADLMYETSLMKLGI